MKAFVPQTAGKPRARREASARFSDQEAKELRSPRVTTLKEQCEAKEKALVRRNSLEYNEIYLGFFAGGIPSSNNVSLSRLTVEAIQFL